MVHACVAKHVKDKKVSLDIVSCMIDINYKSIEPLDAGYKVSLILYCL